MTRTPPRARRSRSGWGSSPNCQRRAAAVTARRSPRSPGRTARQQLAGVVAREVGDLLAGEHARDLLDAAVSRQRFERDKGAAVGDSLAGAEVVVGEARHLR